LPDEAKELATESLLTAEIFGVLGVAATSHAEIVGRLSYGTRIKREGLKKKQQKSLF
jgi:hypothetical protein